MDTHLKILVATSSAVVFTLVAALQGCSSSDGTAGPVDTAGTSNGTTTAGSTSAAGTDTGNAGNGTTDIGGGGASTGAGAAANAGDNGVAAAGSGGADTSGAGAGDTSVGAAGAAGAAGSSTGSAGTAGSSAGGGGASGTTFSVQTSTLGQVLATASGHTLYLFKNDTPSATAPVSACDSNCQAVWPTYYGNPVSVPDSLSASDFSSFTNGSGMQSTYMGWPLYTFFSDANPGDVNGDQSASSGLWLAVKIPFVAPN